MSEDRKQLRKLAERATPGPWKLQTSNSWRRIGTAGGRFADGNVLAPTSHRGDNHPDLAARQEDLDFIVAADPATVLALLDELDTANANHDNAVAHMQSVCAERDRLNAVLIERETIRIGQSLQRHDDQKQIDELVAMGIQQDKDEIARLRAENERWRQNYEHLIEQHMPRTDHGCEEGWSRVVEARELQEQVDQLKAENVQLLAAMMHIMNEVDGNLREIARDLINHGVSTYPDSPANPNDIYEYCDTIERLIAGALPKEQP